MITDIVSITKMIPISGRTRIWPVMSAVTASVAPSDSAPESPMKICAGWTLNHRNPSSAPMIRAQSRARFGWAAASLSNAMMQVRDEGDRDASRPTGRRGRRSG